MMVKALPKKQMCGEKISKKELAFLGHGGLCRDCPECSFPHCPFGKGS